MNKELVCLFQTDELEYRTLSYVDIEITPDIPFDPANPETMVLTGNNVLFRAGTSYVEHLEFDSENIPAQIGVYVIDENATLYIAATPTGDPDSNIVNIPLAHVIYILEARTIPAVKDKEYYFDFRMGAKSETEHIIVTVKPDMKIIGLKSEKTIEPDTLYYFNGTVSEINAEFENAIAQGEGQILITYQNTYSLVVTTKNALKDVQIYDTYARPKTYNEFVGYVLKRLGAPVINIEVSDEQLRDRINDALQYYIEEHMDSAKEFHWLIQVTKDDIRKGYIQFPPEVLDITNVYVHTRSVNYDIDGLDDPQYQFFNNYWQIGSANTGLVYYEMTMQELSLIGTLLNALPQFSWRGRENTLTLYKQMRENRILGVTGWRMVDPDTSKTIWASKWLKEYATAVVGIQWGVNLSKFGNIPSSGNVTIDGQAILQRYSDMKAKLEEEFMQKYTFPPKFFIA